MEKYTIPVLLVFFTRRDITLKTFQCIKKVKPAKLYLASDGGRNENEWKTVRELRELILQQVDWDCEVKTLFQTANLGCGKGVYTAIDWLFQHEESGIIIEDDCLVSDSFFPYMRSMLEKYRDDQRVGMVAGHVFCERFQIPTTYAFSNYCACWGWATWRRAWKNMDFSMEWRKEPDAVNVLMNRGLDQREKRHWLFQLNEIDHQTVSAWDWQWYFTVAKENQLCIFPRVNLVTNIGNDANATHTSFSNIVVSSHELESEYIHPHSVCPSYAINERFYRNGNSLRSKLLRLLPFGLKKMIKRMLTKIK